MKKKERKQRLKKRVVGNIEKKGGKEGRREGQGGTRCTANKRKGGKEGGGKNIGT